jgi:hypothetical protein
MRILFFDRLTCPLTSALLTRKNPLQRLRCSPARTFYPIFAIDRHRETVDDIIRHDESFLAKKLGLARKIRE